MQRSTLMALVVGLLLFLVPFASTGKRCGRACQCRRTCATAVATCGVHGRKAKLCRTRVLRACNRHGLQACEVAPTPTTTTLPRTGYTVTDLGTLGGDTATAHGLDDSGRVVGESTTVEGYSIAFLYSEGRMQSLGAFRPPSVALAINDSGQIVGESDLSVTEKTVFLFSNGVMQDIVPRAATGFCTKYASGPSINNAGQVVGGYRPTDPPCHYEGHGFLYTLGTFKDLGPTLGPIAINDNGDMLTSQGLYDNSGALVVDLGPLLERGGGATAMNNARHIVGSFERTDFKIHAFLYANGAFMDIGEGVANSINASDQIAGNPNGGNAFPEDPIVFLYSGGVRLDLGRLVSGITLKEAVAINDRGQIAANTQDTHAVLLSPR
jgi:probable HAF family extracellular repeat protein